MFPYIHLLLCCRSVHCYNFSGKLLGNVCYHTTSLPLDIVISLMIKDPVKEIIRSNEGFVCNTHDSGGALNTLYADGHHRFLFITKIGNNSTFQ